MSDAPDRRQEPGGSERLRLSQIDDASNRDVTWEMLSEKINDLIILADTTGTIFYASPACRRLGYAQHELIGRTAADFLHPDDLGHFEANGAVLFGAAPPDAAADREHRFRRGDGSWVWLEGNPSLIHGPDGEPMALVNVYRDVTERRAIRAALEASDRRYRLLTDHATDMISQTASDGRMVYVSPSVERVTGYSVAEVLPRQMREFVHPDDLKRFLKFYGALVSGESEGGGAIRYRARHKDGSWIWLESNPRLVRSGVPGEPDQIIDVTRNVAEQQALGAKLRKALAEAEQAAVVKSEFLANMSHEIRTPLTAVLGYTSLLGDRTDLDPAARGQVERVAAAGRGLLALVNDVLDFSKLEAGQTTITPRPTAAGPLAREVLEMFVFQAKAKGLTKRFEAAPDIPDFVAVDPDRLRQILINLVGNGMKFTDRGSVSMRLAYDRAAERLAIEVTDTGPGIAAQAQAKLFQRFSQIDGSSTRSKGGTGLGLAICQGLAEAMGGSISLRSRVGRGSTFRLDLPAPVAKAPVRGGDPSDGRDRLQGLRVLVVDDHAVHRDLVRAMLEPVGIEISEAADGRAGVEIASYQPVDLVLMDIRMPGLDGYGAAAAIRHGHGPNRDVPILAFSAEDERRTARTAASGVFGGWVSKPLAAADLLEALRQALAEQPLPVEEELSRVSLYDRPPHPGRRRR